MIKYEIADDINILVRRIAEKLGMEHLDFSRIICIRSRNSQSKYTIARCHAMPRIMQVALGNKAHYVIEVISEKFDKLDEDEQIKTLIHELMHIPKSFGGGFRHHGDHVTKRNVEKMYERFVN